MLKAQQGLSQQVNVLLLQIKRSKVSQLLSQPLLYVLLQCLRCLQAWASSQAAPGLWGSVPVSAPWLNQSPLPPPALWRGCGEDSSAQVTYRLLKEQQKDNQEPLMDLTVSMLNNTGSRQLRGAGLIPELLI